MQAAAKHIPLNKPYVTGREMSYIQEAIQSRSLSNSGHFAAKATALLNERYHFRKSILVNSCTAALEMAALLLELRPGDEVIVPSYTYVSTANAFALHGARLVFADSYSWHPNADPEHIALLITPKTRAIVVVHYAGIACDMDAIMRLATDHQLFVVEDAAHSIDGYYRSAQGLCQPLGSIGHLATFSFHETKNITCGEGGLLVINDPQFDERADVLAQSGTNRRSFLHGQSATYEWRDIGSSFLPSEITAAFLLGQLANIDQIQERRVWLWNAYFDAFRQLAGDGLVTLPVVKDYAATNGHIFYLCLNTRNQRCQVIDHCKRANIHPASHYPSLHTSKYYGQHYPTVHLPHSEFFTDSLLRLPLYFDLGAEEFERVVAIIYEACRLAVSQPAL